MLDMGLQVPNYRMQALATIGHWLCRTIVLGQAVRTPKIGVVGIYAWPTMPAKDSAPIGGVRTVHSRIVVKCIVNHVPETNGTLPSGIRRQELLKRRPTNPTVKVARMQRTCFPV